MCQKQKYAPSVFEKYVTTISLGGKETKLNLYDTAGKIRTLHVQTLVMHSLVPTQNINMRKDGRVWSVPSSVTFPPILQRYVWIQTSMYFELRFYLAVLTLPDRGSGKGLCWRQSFIIIIIIIQELISCLHVWTVHSDSQPAFILNVQILICNLANTVWM